MSEEFNELEILDNTFKEITKKVAKLEMYNIDFTSLDKSNLKSLMINTLGDRKITLIMYADMNVMRAITESMKRGKKADDSEVVIYTKEYFNIFCGRATTTMNNITKKSVRFSVPTFVDNPNLDNVVQECLDIKSLYYRCDYGPVKLEVIHQN